MPDGSFILAVLDRLGAPLRSLVRRVRARIIGPVALVPYQPECLWYLEKRVAEDAMVAIAVLHVTNMGKHSIRLVSARMPVLDADDVPMVQPDDLGTWDDYSLSPGEHVLAKAFFYGALQPPEEQRRFIGDVVLVDNLAREHRCRRVVFWRS